MSKKPIRVFYSDLSGSFYATQYYREEPAPNGKGTIFIVTGQKYDVTQDIARAIVEEDIVFTPRSKDADNTEAQS